MILLHTSNSSLPPYVIDYSNAPLPQTEPHICNSDVTDLQ